MKAIFAPLAASVALLAALSGCQGAAPVAPNTPAAAAAQTASVVAHLDLTGPTGYRLQALTAWNLADVDHVKLSLQKKVNGSYADVSGVTKTVARASLSAPITLSNLRMATEYKVVARAFADAAGTSQIDNIAEKGSDADCSVAFTTPSVVTTNGVEAIDDATRTITIPVRLKNKTFAGAAGAANGVAVTNGNIVDTANPESF